MSDVGDNDENGKIRRYGERSKPFSLPASGAESCNAITEHVEAHIGPVSGVYHEIISDLVHLDVLMVPADGGRKYHALVTSGMSDLPMAAPPVAAECRFAELIVFLPASWPLPDNGGTFDDELHYWPVRWLKMLARFPHEYDTWLWSGHTMPNGDPAQPFSPATKLSGWMLVEPTLVDMPPLDVGPERPTHFFSLMPLYDEEMAFKIENGADALLEKLARVGATDVINLRRKNVCRKSWWPF